MTEMKELDYYYRYLFEESGRMEMWRKGLSLLTLFCLSCSVYASGYLLYATTLSALFFHIFTWFLKTKIEENWHAAHEFQKISLLYSAYATIPSDFELSHLKAKVSLWVYDQVKKSIETNDEGAEYTVEKKNEGRKTLIAMIHENSYWNHHLYKYIFIKNIVCFSIIFILVVLVSLFIFPFIKTDPNFSLPRLGFTFLSFTILYEFLEATLNYRNASRKMLNIDNELSRTSSLSDEILLTIFNQYNQAKLATSNIPNTIYLKNKDKLNDGWNKRIRH